MDYRLKPLENVQTPRTGKAGVVGFSPRNTTILRGRGD
jgi:hypothetical protein